MKVSLLQAPTIAIDIHENRRWVRENLHKSLEDQPDVILLPELWNTGFDPQLISSIDNYHQEEIRQDLSSFAKEHKVNLVAGSIAYKERGKRLNHTMIFNREGEEVSHYDKVHLFTGSNEADFLDAGSSLCQFSLDSIPCGLITCYDLRFPEWARLTAMEGAKILFVPAAWPLSRVYQMQLFARARAAENQLFVLVCNATKAAGHHALSGGHSSVYDPYGREVLDMDTPPGIASLDLDLSLIEEVKSHLNLWRDRRPGLYKGLDKE